LAYYTMARHAREMGMWRVDTGSPPDIMRDLGGRIELRVGLTHNNPSCTALEQGGFARMRAQSANGLVTCKSTQGGDKREAKMDNEREWPGRGGSKPCKVRGYPHLNYRNLSNSGPVH